MRKVRLPLLGLFGLMVLGHSAAGLRPGDVLDAGTLSIYFQDEKVGYEEFVWREDPEGYELKVSGRMSKPFRLDIESMTLRLSKDFIPREYLFKGAMNGMSQEIMSRIVDGNVENTIRVAGQENVLEINVRRDAFVLPNPLFSPYLVLAKKFGCELKGKTEIAAYLIPQVEITGTLESSAGDPCALTLDLAGVQILLVTNAERKLVSLSMPSQNLRVEVKDTD